MKSKGLVGQAANLLQNGKFEEALYLYEEAERVYGKGLFDYNIEYCRREIDESTVPEVSSVNTYFDHVYVVNLPHQSDKRIKVVNQLKKARIDHELFEAMNGYVGKPLEKYEEYLNKPIGSMSRFSEFNNREISRNRKFLESAGAVGYIFSYLRILEHAKNNGYREILILEDDIILCHDFEYRLKKFMSSVHKNWKVLQLGASQYGWGSVDKHSAEQEGYYFPRRLDTTGSFAIAFNLDIVDEIIAAQEAFEAPFDHLPMGEIYEKYLGECFVAYPNLIMPDVADSSIRGGRCQHTHSKRVQWNVDNFVYPYPKPSIALVIASAKNLKYFSNFTKPNKSSFDLRLYITSSDGLRPIHNRDKIADDYLTDKSVLETSHVLSADFYALVEHDLVLTEELIEKYIEYRLGINGGESKGFYEFTPNVTRRVPGKVSVIIPTYKRPTNLKTAVTSVLEQDYDNFEVIIVNDNGVDSEYNQETDAVVEQLSLQDPFGRVKYLKHTINRNGAAARNTGILRANGEYIAFLDDDDMYLPNRLSDCINVLRDKNRRFGAAYCGFLGWNSPKNDPDRYKEGDLTKELLLLDYFKHYLHTNTATYKYESVHALNGFDESYRRHQDLEFNVRFFEQYEVLATKTVGVRLNPAPSEISNKVYDLSMLKLKEKFLGQFENNISRFEEADEIYEKHWSEVVRYVNDKADIIDTILANSKNGELQVLAKLRQIYIRNNPSDPIR